MQVPFTKMNSQGNDFVVIDNTGLLYQFDNKKIRSICSRDIVGCDQLLLLNIKDSNNVTCEIFNQDGSSAKQCGNGMRAIMLFLNRKYNFLTVFILLFASGVTLFFGSAAGEAAGSLDKVRVAGTKRRVIIATTGNGKGKSSSAMGMICRALGYGLKVGLVRF